jgi:hypothetical protein
MDKIAADRVAFREGGSVWVLDVPGALRSDEARNPWESRDGNRYRCVIGGSPPRRLPL